MEKSFFTKSWTSHTMTSENYVRIKGAFIHYGVESLDDEQAFRSYCLVKEFIDSEANWWVSANFNKEQVEEICKTIRELILPNSPKKND